MKRGPSMHDESLSEPPSTLSESAGASGLLPCPFCSTQARLIKPYSGESNYVMCPKCHIATLPSAYCVEDWNTRAAPVQIAENGTEILDVANALLFLQEEMLSEDVRGCLGKAAHYLKKYAALLTAPVQAWLHQEIHRFTRHKSVADKWIASGQLIEPVYASPPTPVPGEPTVDQIQSALDKVLPLDAIENLRNYQEQLDMDGCMVGVSRQALEELLAIFAPATPVSAGLDDMGKQRPQIESSKTTDDLPQRPASEAK